MLLPILLRFIPCLRRFITAFNGEPNTSFWKHVMFYADELFWKDNLSGWITAFCVWSNRDQWRGGTLPRAVLVKPNYIPILPSPTAARDISPAPTPATKRLNVAYGMVRMSLVLVVNGNSIRF